MKRYFILLGILLTFSTSGLVFAQKKTLSIEDLIKMRTDENGLVSIPEYTWGGPVIKKNRANLVPFDLERMGHAWELKSEQERQNNRSQQKYKDPVQRMQLTEKMRQATYKSFSEKELLQLQSFYRKHGNFLTNVPVILSIQRELARREVIRMKKREEYNNKIFEADLKRRKEEERKAEEEQRTIQAAAARRRLENKRAEPPPNP